MKCHIRIDYDPPRFIETFWWGPQDERLMRLAERFKEAGFNVNLTCGHNRNTAPGDVDAVIITVDANDFATEILQFFVEWGESRKFYVRLNDLSTGVHESQVLIRLGLKG